MCIVLISLPLFSFAQGENNNWLFPYSSWLKFSNTSEFIADTALPYIQNSISDAGGNLLFSVSYDKAYDKNFNIMPNGMALSTNNVVPQTLDFFKNAVIVPSPANEKQYYIITIKPQALSSGYINVAYYSIIDMNLNNGLGDVVLGSKAIPLASDVGGPTDIMVASQASSCLGYWIVLHKRRSSIFWAFSLTSAGLSINPVVSHGIFGGNNYDNVADYQNAMCYNNLTGRIINCWASNLVPDGKGRIETALLDKAKQKNALALFLCLMHSLQMETA